MFMGIDQLQEQRRANHDGRRTTTKSDMYALGGEWSHSGMPNMDSDMASKSRLNKSRDLMKARLSFHPNSNYHPTSTTHGPDYSVA